MRLLFIRHGDPDYVNDTLTEKGHREAALLAEHASDLNLGTCYVSPLGRAQATADYSLKKLGITADTLEWLKEFPAKIDLGKVTWLRSAYPNTLSQYGEYTSRIVWDVRRLIGRSTVNVWIRTNGENQTSAGIRIL